MHDDDANQLIHFGQILGFVCDVGGWIQDASKYMLAHGLHGITDSLDEFSGDLR